MSRLNYLLLHGYLFGLASRYYTLGLYLLLVYDVRRDVDRCLRKDSRSWCCRDERRHLVTLFYDFTQRRRAIEAYKLFPFHSKILIWIHLVRPRTTMQFA